MTYVSQSWVTGDQVTAAELTDLSGAVVSASSGIADMAIDQSTSHLQVTLADGDLVDAGPVPAASDATVAPILQDTATASYAAAQSAAHAALDATIAGKVAKGDIFVNVMDHGAVGDGITDDTAAIQAALADAGTTRNVLLPGGVYLVGGLTIAASQCIQGDSRGQTILRHNPAYAGPTVQTLGAVANLGATTPNTADMQSDFIVQDIEIDGNSANVTAGAGGHGLAVYGMAYELRNVYIHNTVRKGLWSQGPSGTGIGTGAGIAARIDNLRVVETGDGDDAVLWDGPHDTLMTRVSIINHDPSQPSRVVHYGLHVGTNGVGLQIAEGHIWGINHDYAARWDASAWSTNTQYEGSRYAHVWIRANSCNIYGGQIYTAGQLNTACGVRVGDSSGTTPVYVSGYIINTCFYDARGGAIWWDKDAGGDVVAYGSVVASATGTLGYTGAPHPTYTTARLKIVNAETSPYLLQFGNAGAPAAPAAATDSASAITAVNALRTSLINLGLMTS